MSLLPPPTSTSATEAKAVAKAATFGPAYSGEGESRTANPIPSLGDVDMALLLQKLNTTALEVIGDKRDAFMAAVEAIQKPQFPAHKAGKAAYAVANYVAGIFRHSATSTPAPRKKLVDKLNEKLNAAQEQLAAVRANLIAAGFTEEQIKKMFPAE